MPTWGLANEPGREDRGPGNTLLGRRGRATGTDLDDFLHSLLEWCYRRPDRRGRVNVGHVVVVKPVRATRLPKQEPLTPATASPTCSRSAVAVRGGGATYTPHGLFAHHFLQGQRPGSKPYMYEQRAKT